MFNRVKTLCKAVRGIIDLYGYLFLQESFAHVVIVIDQMNSSAGFAVARLNDCFVDSLTIKAWSTVTGK